MKENNEEFYDTKFCLQIFKESFKEMIQQMRMMGFVSRLTRLEREREIE